MPGVVFIRGKEWKVDDIADDVAWCRSQEWALSRYTKVGDHGHCSICWWTLSVSDDPGVGEGYLSGRQRWLCKECYVQFIANA